MYQKMFHDKIKSWKFLSAFFLWNAALFRLTKEDPTK
jgi:hypothetical protein